MVFNLASLAIVVAVAVQGTPASPEPAAPSAREQVICKRFVKTGSLVRQERECRTEREWARLRQQLIEMRGGLASCRTAGDGKFCD